MKVFLISFIIMTSFQLLAEETDIFDLAAKYNEKKHQVLSLEEKRRVVLADIYKIEKETALLVNEKSDLDDRKLRLDEDLKDISRRIVQLEEEIRQMTPDLTERLAFVEQVNHLPWFYTFLTSQTVNDLDHTFKIATELNNVQADQVIKFVSLIEEFEDRKIELKKTALEIVRVRKNIEKKEKTITSNQTFKRGLLKRLERNINKEKKQLASIKATGKQVAALSEFENLGLLFGGDFFDKKGQLPLPVEGRLLQDYGINQMLRRDHVDLVHKGHFYQTSANAAVQAVAEGRVIHVGAVDGFSQVVIVDHGGRYYSIYGNLKKALLKKGSLIKQGDQLGLTGHKHLQMGLGLYFEIRHFSQPQDPKKWLEMKSSNLATL